MSISRGSMWSKWDLHIHTPASICQNYGGEQAWEKFITALENLPKDVKVIGITDYYFIDGYETVMKYKSKGRMQNIDKIFPILEFRVDKFGTSSIGHPLQKLNLNIVFDVDESQIDIEIQNIKQKFIGLIPICSGEDFKCEMLSRESFARLGKDLQNGFSSLIPPSDKVFEKLNDIMWKDKTFLFIGHDEWSSIESKQQLKPIKNDLFKMANAFLTSNNDALIIEKNQVWLNGFGKKRLLQSLDIHDFERLGTKYSCLTWIKAEPSFEGLRQIIHEPFDRVKIQNSHPETKANHNIIDHIILGEEDFWKQEIYLNPGLNSIIGGRSTGKSLLLWCIANHMKRLESSSNITNAQFYNEHSEKLGLVWADGERCIRDIDYFPQNYMHDLAFDIEKKDKLISRIITEKDKGNAKRAFEGYCDELMNKIASDIAELFNNQRDLKSYERDLHNKGDRKGIENEITRLRLKIDEIHKESGVEKFDKTAYEKTKSAINDITIALSKLNLEMVALKEIRDLIFIAEIPDRKLSLLSAQVSNKVGEIYSRIKDIAIKEWNAQIDSFMQELETTKNKLIQERINYETSEEFRIAQQAIIGNQEIQSLEEQEALQKRILNEIDDIEDKMAKLQISINNKISNVVVQHLSYYTLADRFCKEISMQNSDVIITPAPYLMSYELERFLDDRLNKRSNARKEYITDFVTCYEKNPEEALTDFLTKAISDSIEYKSTYTSQQVVSDLFTTNWYKITYKIFYQGDEFTSMSQGKKSFVILKMLLEFSDRKCPILIDQPEDSLDNRAIFVELVTYLRVKKSNRQIILVTHNPNIVVGADSELVIVANQHANDTPNCNEVKFQYATGGLEISHPYDEKEKITLKRRGIREHVCDILEGGVEAFKIREEKYCL